MLPQTVAKMCAVLRYGAIDPGQLCRSKLAGRTMQATEPDSLRFWAKILGPKELSGPREGSRHRPGATGLLPKLRTCCDRGGNYSSGSRHVLAARGDPTSRRWEKNRSDALGYVGQTPALSELSLAKKTALES